MTITLDYIDLQFDDDREVMTADALEFQYELLMAQVVFRVDAADFSFGGYTTLLEAAAILDGRVSLLADGQTSTYENPLAWDKLSFSRSGGQVTISASYTDATATVGLDELKTAVSAFYQRVTEVLLTRYPGLDQTPGARPYFDTEGLDA